MLSKDKRRIYQRERHQRFKAAGLCSCGREPVKGYKKCAICSYQRGFQYKRYLANHRLERMEYLRDWKSKQIEMGNCPNCGSPLMEDEDSYCFSCKAN